MRLSRVSRKALLAAPAVAALTAAPALAATSPSPYASALSNRAAVGAAATLTPVVSGLDNPRHLHWLNGHLYVTEAGHGGKGPCVSGGEGGGPQCAGRSGRVVELVPTSGGGYTVRTVVQDLSSVAGSDGTGATGPSDILRTRSGDFVTLVQDEAINTKGVNPFGKTGNDLGRLIVTHNGSNVIGKDFAAYEAAHNPDHGLPGPPDPESPIDSDPYGMTWYRGGIAVADAAANDLLWLNTTTNQLSVLAVFPVVNVTYQGHPMQTQAVPTDVKVGPDGALYVTELTGFPFQPGSSKIYRVVPGKGMSVYASGLTNVVAEDWDENGRLVVVEIAEHGLTSNDPTGALVRINKDGSKTVLADRGLLFPTGIAIQDDYAYVSNAGIAPASGFMGITGNVVRIRIT